MKKIAKGAVVLSCVLAMGAGSLSLMACVSQGNSAASEAGQQDASVSQGAYTFTDDLGRDVTVTSHERVVAGMGQLRKRVGTGRRHVGGASDNAFSDYRIALDAQKAGDFHRWMPSRLSRSILIS